MLDLHVYIIIGLIGICIILWFMYKRFNLRRAEIKIWNQGICAQSGKPWVMMEHGINELGRGYYDTIGHYIFITYDVDNKSCINKK